MIGGMWSQRRSRPITHGAADPGGPDALPDELRGTRGFGRTAGPDPGGGPRPGEDPITVAPLEEVLAAIESLDLDRPWTAVAPQVLPVLPRRRPFPGEAEPPVRRSWPPGLETSFGVDIGPAFLYIGAWALDRWGVTMDELADRAIANIRERAARRRHHGLLRDAVGGMPISAYQSQEGWASALLLVPDELVRVFGPEPSLILAPMRDLLVQLPIDADPGLAAWLLEDFAALDPNGLKVPMMALVDGELSLVTRATRGKLAAAGRRH
jgi:hypothetical protein